MHIPETELDVVHFQVVHSSRVAHLPYKKSNRFKIIVPERWRSEIPKNPFADKAQVQILAWFKSLGCTSEEIARAEKFDAAGYVGIPFPSLDYDSTVLIGKYLSMWLLWDDVQVESLENRWRIDKSHILENIRPEGMTRFDQGWWQLFQKFASRRSREWIIDLCEAMITWNDAAISEAKAIQVYRDCKKVPDFGEQMEMRIATIGMYATVYLLEDAYGVELPREFHSDPVVIRLKKLSNQIVGLGNDIFSFGKDIAEDQINLASTLMMKNGIGGCDALEQLICLHDAALAEYDRLADSIGSWGGEIDTYIKRWIQDVRYASVGFTIWESLAPRYTAHTLVSNGCRIQPEIEFS